MFYTEEVTFLQKRRLDGGVAVLFVADADGVGYFVDEDLDADGWLRAGGFGTNHACGQFFGVVRSDLGYQYAAARFDHRRFPALAER
jgi:hypothetical protein